MYMKIVRLCNYAR